MAKWVEGKGKTSKQINKKVVQVHLRERERKHFFHPLSLRIAGAQPSNVDLHAMNDNIQRILQQSTLEQV